MKSPGKGCPAGQNTVGKKSWSPLPQRVAVAPHSRDLTFKHMKREGKVLGIRAHYCFPSLFYSLMCSQHFNQNKWLLPAGWFWISSMLYLLLILLSFLERPSLWPPNPNLQESKSCLFFRPSPIATFLCKMLPEWDSHIRRKKLNSWLLTDCFLV